ncbi:Alkaline phosphatase [uncultured Rubrobacteraceae bacterium]|uniref:Alkaline phosphatase n=1 Tax=uncultured Rubrobacteraceae bacterium TaxID=349277 RepID=A0A6J4P776_9ACTN|nr:Alkaline phosphatase [uncultured Rubrobacteraceae bacterium]
MSLKQSTVAPPDSQERARRVEKRSGLARLLLVAFGVLLLTLAAGSALADSVRGGDTSALRGTNGGERLADFGAEDGIWGFGGDDELYGGEGGDLILGGTGDDFIEAKDGEVDFVGCGSGNDVASVDLVDRVARDCETIYPG